MKIVAVLLVFTLLASPVSAATEEARARSFWSDFEITLMQTFPFAVLWSYFAERQLSNYLFPGTAPHWSAILTVAGAVSIANAFFSNYSSRTRQQQNK